MKVELIDFTGKGHMDSQWYAANLLIFTKRTRLEVTLKSLVEIQVVMTDEQKLRELREMSNTIPSSWEFVDLTFLVSGISRAAAQQMTRTRNASYAMQSMRVVDASGLEVVNPFLPETESAMIFDGAAEHAQAAYRTLCQEGVAKEDARGLLPLATATNLVVKYNLRAFVDLVDARSSLRTQSEYAAVVAAMKSKALAVWPWAEPFFESPMDKALLLIESAAAEAGITTGNGLGWKLAKAADLIRKGKGAE